METSLTLGKLLNPRDCLVGNLDLVFGGSRAIHVFMALQIVYAPIGGQQWLQVILLDSMYFDLIVVVAVTFRNTCMYTPVV